MDLMIKLDSSFYRNFGTMFIRTTFCRADRLIQLFARRTAVSCTAISSSSSASSSSSSDAAIQPEEYKVEGQKREVIRNIASAISDQTRALFAVIYIQRKQFKVMQDDIIHVEHNIPLDVGEEMKFEKVLLVGGADFTLIGRPMLDPKFVHVRATVIEKTITSPEVAYDFRKQNVHCPIWLSQELTVLRINNINVDEAVMGETTAQ